MVRPEVQEQKTNQVKPGITPEYSYLQGDPKSYFYQKFKANQSKYLNDEMWAEAAKRGESDLLTYYIQENEKADNQNLLNGHINNERINIASKIDEYTNVLDYDGYIAALANATLDDTDKTRQERYVKDYQGNDIAYNNGQKYTDKEWNEEILKSQFERYDALILEEYKANRDWWQVAAENLFAIPASVTMRILTGASRFIGDIYNIGEGLLNVMFNWSGDDSIDSKFLYAFQNDDWLQQCVGDMSQVIQDIEKRYTNIVDAVKLYDDPQSGGMNSWGQSYAGIVDSIGYMLPSIMLNAGLASAMKAAGTVPKTVQGFSAIRKGAHSVNKLAAISKIASRGFFYLGVEGGNIAEKVQTAQLKGISYKDLNAGEVLLNATLKTVGQMLVEDALSAIMGLSATDKALYGSSYEAGRVANKAIGDVTATGGSAFLQTIGRGLKGSLKEGLEETLQDLSDGLIDYAFSGLGTNLSEVYAESGADKVNIKNLVQSFILGAATSIVIGAFQNLEYIPEKNRATYEGADGKAYKMGFFQTLNFNAAMQTLNEWSNTISDNGAKPEARLNAAYRMAAAIDTMTPLFRSWSETELATANSLLMSSAMAKAAKEQNKQLYVAPDFAQKLYASFVTNNIELDKKYIAPKKSLKEKLLASFNNLKDKFKKHNVSEVKNIVTVEMADNDVNLPTESTQKIKRLAKTAGAKAVVTTDTDLTSQDGDILYVPEKLAIKGDVPTILQGAGFDKVIDVVTKALDKDTRNYIRNLFRKLSGDKKADYDTAMKALLFDKTFYTQLLLNSENTENAIKILSQIDKIINQPALSGLKEGTITQDAYNTLMKKVKENMTQGLKEYCTKFVLVDLDNISNDVLSAEDKKEIRQYASVMFSEACYSMIDKTQTPNKSKIELLDEAIDIFTNSNPELNARLKEAIRSNDIKERTDAIATLTYQANYSRGFGDKIILLPIDRDKVNFTDESQLDKFESLFNYKSYQDIVNGKFTVKDISKEVKELIKTSNGKYSLKDITSTRLLLRDLLVKLTDYTFTIDISTGQLLKIYESKIIKQNYLSNPQLVIDDIKNGKIKTLRDIVLPQYIGDESSPFFRLGLFTKLPSAIANCSLTIDNTLPNDISGQYSQDYNTIEINPKYNLAELFNTILHEATHATQSIIRYMYNKDISAGRASKVEGGNPEKLAGSFTFEEAKRLNKYLSENYPITYQFINMQNSNVNFAHVLYSLLEGEMQARLTTNTLLGTLGFTYIDKNGKTYLTDGSKEGTFEIQGFSRIVIIPNMIQPGESDTNKSSTQIFDYTKLQFIPITDTKNKEKLELEAKYRITIDEALIVMSNELKLNDNEYNQLLYKNLSENLKNKLASYKPSSRVNIDGKAFSLIKEYINSNIKPSEVFQTYNSPNAEASYTPDNKPKRTILQEDLEKKYGLNVADTLKTVAGYLDLKGADKDSLYFGTASDATINKLYSYDTSNLNDDEKQWFALAKDYVKAEVKFYRDTKAWYDAKKSKKDETYVPYKKGTSKVNRQITAEEAKGTNLEYWTKRGIYQLNPAVKQFVISTTKDFKKLPKVLQEQIKNATLTYQSLSYYVKTAANMDEYTFEHIAKAVFNNDALINLGLKNMKKLANDIEVLATLSELAFIDPEYIDENKVMTIDEMYDTYKEIVNKSRTDKQLAKDLTKASEIAGKTKKEKGTRQMVEAHADPDTLPLMFFMHYDGTLNSIRKINNLGKLVDYNTEAKHTTFSTGGEDEDSKGTERMIEGAAAGESVTTGTTAWNWLDKFAKADIDYEYGTIEDSLDSIDRSDKEELVRNYVIDNIALKLKSMSTEEKLKNAAAAKAAMDKELKKIENMNDEALDRAYIKVLSMQATFEKEVSGKVELESPTDIKADTKERNLKKLKSASDTLLKRIAGMKGKFNQLPDEVKKYFAPIMSKSGKTVRGYKSDFFIPVMSKDGKKVVRWDVNEKYANLTNNEVKQILKDIRSANETLGRAFNKEEISKLARKKAKEILAERGKKITVDSKGQEVKTDKPQTLKEKVGKHYIVKVENQDFNFNSDSTPNKLTTDLINTNWAEKKRMSTVQGLTNNVEKDVANGKEFFKQNAEALLSASLSDIEDTVNWFLDARMNNADDAQIQKYQAVKGYFFYYVMSNARQGGLYENLNPNTKARIENWLKNTVTAGATMMAIHNNMKGLLNPIEAMKQADFVIDGVPISTNAKNEFFDAIDHGDIKLIDEAEQKVIDEVEKQRTGKKSIQRKILMYRSLSMLSSPMTWLRNKVSNIALENLNKLSNKIGNKIFPKHSVKGQLLLDTDITVTFTKDGKVKFDTKDESKKGITKEIQDFVATNFIDNGFFDKVISNVSKYNPNDIDPKFKDKLTGEPTKEAVMSQLMLKAMYNKYYNKNMFKSKAAQKAYQFLMKAMSDDSYVRRATMRYFGKILAEKGTDLTKGVTDGIMFDFAKAMGLALRDYMHSDNIFNKFERMMMEKNEAVYTIYKLLVPYASSAWNWFKGMLNYSPIGLLNAINKFRHLEDSITKNEAKWMTGDSDIPPELTEHFIRRDLGAGVIGTIGWILGAILAGLGIIGIDDDDYGVPKIRLGNLVVDISDIFGASSILSGAALVSGIKDGDLMKALNQSAQITFDSFPLMDILQNDMFSTGLADLLATKTESIALSFIPNFITYVSGATYTGKINKNTFWARLGAKIPFVGNFLPKKVNPYDGSTGSIIDIINRVVPYFSWEAATLNESKTNELGLNKTQIRGQYTINGEKFNVTGKDLQTLNESYGKWNANDLSKFYTNQMRVKVKTDTGYKELTYNQMTDRQRKNAVQSIMSNNAELAKIYAWTKSGNKYYATAEMYEKLHKHGIRTNVYRGTKGFESK